MPEFVEELAVDLVAVPPIDRGLPQPAGLTEEFGAAYTQSLVERDPLKFGSRRMT
jgi:hypothetical protein